MTQVTVTFTFFQSPARQEHTSHLEGLSVFHVRGTVSVLKELLPVQPVNREELLIVTGLSVVSCGDEGLNCVNKFILYNTKLSSKRAALVDRPTTYSWSIH